MSTRGSYGFIKNGVEKIAYNQMDSYPSGLGVTMQEFITNHSINDLNSLFDKIRMIKENGTPSKQDRETYKILFENVSTGKDWYSLLRGLQGVPEMLFEFPIMIDNNEFLDESLFCEYAYIINLDTNKLEIYKGFNKDANAKGRYAGRAWDKKKEIIQIENKLLGEEDKYCGVELIKEIDLKDVPNISMGQIEKDCDGE